jgi:hypothetical protein
VVVVVVVVPPPAAVASPCKPSERHDASRSSRSTAPFRSRVSSTAGALGLVNPHGDGGVAAAHALGVEVAVLFRQGHAAERGQEAALALGAAGGRTGPRQQPDGVSRDAGRGELVDGPLRVGGVLELADDRGLLVHGIASRDGGS